MAAALEACCAALGCILRGTRTLRQDLTALRDMEVAFAALLAEAGEDLGGQAGTGGAGAAAEASTSGMSFSLFIATLFTVCTRVGRG